MGKDIIKLIWNLGEDIRNNPKVINMERTNIRYLERNNINV